MAKKASKKSQITIFIILGMVILIIFGIVFSFSGKSQKAALDAKIERVYGDFLRTTSIDTLVQQCLERSAKDAIVLSSLQGGRIYDTQVNGGFKLQSLADAIPFNASEYTLNISYGIRAKDTLSTYPDGFPLVQSPRSALPSPNQYGSLFAKRESDLSNPYSLTPLCNFYGPNYYLIPNASFSCETSTVTNRSIQEYLRLFIINKTQECINFLQFSQASKSAIVQGNVTADVVMGNNAIGVGLSFPLLIEIKNAPAVTKVLEASYSPKVRLKKIHELAAHLIGFNGPFSLQSPPTADADNIFFDIDSTDPNDCTGDTGQTGNQCILPGMEVVKKRDVCLDNPDTEQCALVSSISSHYTYTDILNITDSESAIEGVPLTFLYAIENRAPAIGFVPEQKFPADTEYFLTFIARDPDEDTLTYTLDEDYDELSYAYTADQDGNGVFTDEGGASSGDYSLKIRVTDDEGLFDEQEFNLKIED